MVMVAVRLLTMPSAMIYPCRKVPENASGLDHRETRGGDDGKILNK
jgi:hypothetical protein